MSDKELKQQEEVAKWRAREEKLKAAGSGMQKAGASIMMIGCLATLLITVPIIIIAFLLL